MQRRSFVFLVALAGLLTSCARKPVATPEPAGPVDTRLRFSSGTECEEMAITGPKADQILAAMDRLEKGTGVTREKKVPGYRHGVFSAGGPGYLWQGGILFRDRGDHYDIVRVPFMMGLAKKFVKGPMTWEQTEKVVGDYFR